MTQAGGSCYQSRQCARSAGTPRARARELNVQAPSLYHHFRDRADILRTVARAIVLQSRVPAPAACRTWVDWFVGISLSFRRAVLSHRNAAPILLEFMPRDVLISNRPPTGRASSARAATPP